MCTIKDGISMKLSAFLKKSSFIAKSYYQSLQNINMLGKILMEYHNLPTLQTSFSSLPFMYECAFLLSHVQLFAIPWTIDHEATLSMGFSRQEYWSRLPFPPPGDLPNPGIEPLCLSHTLAGRFLAGPCMNDTH